jgi:4-hydroxybenzoate polyprenyltransferase
MQPPPMSRGSGPSQPPAVRPRPMPAGAVLRIVVWALAALIGLLGGLAVLFSHLSASVGIAGFLVATYLVARAVDSISRDFGGQPPAP